MRYRISRLCFCLCLLLTLVPSARATQLIPRTLPELAAGAQMVFIGRCESVASHWNADHSLILTANRFRVLRALKGAPAATVVLDELGGMVGNVGMNVSGVPRYAVGDEVLLFVHRTELGRLETFGAGQGRFTVARDAQGRPWVSSDFYRADLAAMTPPGMKGEGAPLDLFATRLRAVAARTEGTRR